MACKLQRNVMANRMANSNNPRQLSSPGDTEWFKNIYIYNKLLITMNKAKVCNTVGTRAT